MYYLLSNAQNLLQEGQATGRERTGRNIISNDSARVSHGGAPVEDDGGPIGMGGLFGRKPKDSNGGGVERLLGGGGYNRRKTAPEPPPYDDVDDTAVTPEAQLPLPSSSFSVNARSTALASTVPERNGNADRAAARARPGVVVQEPVYLVTDTYPFTHHQFDREDEERLLVSERVFVAEACWFVGVYVVQNTGRSRNN